MQPSRLASFDSGHWPSEPFLRFDLTGFDPNTATLSGHWGVDNQGKILLNGQTPPGSGALSLTQNIPGNFTKLHDFLITGGFKPGINPLEFVVPTHRIWVP